MIVTEIYSGSGLGNQIWNLVVTRILAEKHGYRWGVKKSTTFKSRKFMPDFYFGDEVIGGHTPIEGQTPSSLPDGIVNYITERNDPLPQCGHSGIFFDDNLWNHLPDNSKIDGLFQCLGYINDRKDDIRNWLTHNINIAEYSDDNICVIHFRGGEYLITASWCPQEYYSMSRDIMLEYNSNMKFVVVTDDPENAKKFIPWADVVGAATLNDQEDIEQGTGFYKYRGGNIGVDYSILHNAKNIIMSSSTFSFWPVWTSKLSEKVIAPKYWFDYKSSNGWWRGDDIIVKEWDYIDTKGVLKSGIECQEEYDLYKSLNSYYNSSR